MKTINELPRVFYMRHIYEAWAFGAIVGFLATFSVAMMLH
jgi:hypothetical protein